MRRPNIEFHIEELVLHSFAPGDRYAIADSLQQELRRLLAGQSLQPDFSSALLQQPRLARVDGGSFTVEQNSKPSAIGAQIAEAINGGLTK